MSKHTSNDCPLRKTSIGGQALMEGIMMRGPKVTAMAVRNPRGEIVIETLPTVGKERPRICRWPIIRGVLGFVDSMTFGYKCLMRSAEISGLEELEAEMAREKQEKRKAKKAKKQGLAVDEEGTDPVVEPQDASPCPAETCSPLADEESTPSPFSESSPAETPVASAEEPTIPSEETASPSVEKKKESSLMMTLVMVFSVAFALVIAVGLFVVAPAALYDHVLERFIPWFESNESWMQSIFEGVIRILLLIGYMSLMLLMKDIRRTFRFHGAEHKTIFCYEQGLELTVENVRKQRRFHPRCGTSFLVLMVLVSVIIGLFIPTGIPTALRVVCKLALFPLIMGVGYELIRLCGRHDNFLTRIIAAPGLWFQRITVLEPDDSMIECAIAAMERVIPNDDSDRL